jgi:hypothetical protein
LTFLLVQNIKKIDRDSLLAMDDQALLAHCRVEVERGTGPGGQKRNRTESAVRLTIPGIEPQVQVLCDKTRSQHDNRAIALRELRVRLALLVRRPVVEKIEWNKPPSMKNADYAQWLAVVLDRLCTHDWRVGDCAKSLSISTNQLTKAITRDPRASREVNRRRQQNNLPFLH